MTWDPTMAGLRLGALYGYRTLIQNNLPALNAHLAWTDPAGISLGSLGLVAPSMVEIGDPDTMPEEDWTIRIRITGGDDDDGLSSEFDRALYQVFNNVGWRSMYRTYVRCYLAQNALYDKDPFRMARNREITIARIEDWFTFGVFNYVNRATIPVTGGTVIPLTSTVYAVDGTLDHLIECHVERITHMVPPKGPGRTDVLKGLTCVCYAELQ